MYKIYMITELTKTDSGEIQTNPTIEFSKVFLPQLNTAFFRDSETSGETESAAVAQAG